MNIKFDEKRALVTGAGKGIGKAVAIRLSECGAEVLAVSRTQADLDELSKAYPNIKTLCLDVGNWDATKNAIEKVGPIDLLVNNAGIGDQKELGELSEAHVDKYFNINSKAAINISQIVANGMKARGQGGAIVNVSSICGFRGILKAAAYCISKGALDQLTRCMAIEFGPYNIRVNSVNPTAIRTNMTATLFAPGNEYGQIKAAKTLLRRLGEVDDVAYPILFLLSDKASFITGIVLPIDAGLSVMF